MSTSDTTNEIISKQNLVATINGEAKTFKTSEVANFLKETPQMIRYYSSTFENFLELDHETGKHRSFNKEQIKKLEYILYLKREKNFSEKQIQEFLSTPEGKMMSPTAPDGIDKVQYILEQLNSIIKSDLAPIIQSAINQEISIALKEIMPQFSELHESNKQLESTIDSYNQNVKENFNSINTTLKQSEKLSLERSERVDTLLKSVREQAINPKEQTKKSLLKRIFSK